MHKNIGYHTRLYGDSSQKITGGSFGGQVDHETIERLSQRFSVVVKPSGTPVFVDKKGREVWVYVTVDPRTTTNGKQALADWYKLRQAEEDRQLEEAEREEQELNELTRGLTHAEIVRRLKTIPQ